MWWIIGISLISANISTEQFVGMSANAANYMGLAVASYEWIAAISLVLVAFIFLPRFLKAGIYTIPQFLETRYNKAARALMSLTMVFVLVCVSITAVTYSGSKFYSEYLRDFGLPNLALFGLEIPLTLTFFCWLIGILAASYVFVGGLKACAWADLIQGTALILCGGIILMLALGALGGAGEDDLRSAIQANATQRGIEIPQDEQEELLIKLKEGDSFQRFTDLNSHKLRMNLPWNDSFLPITALFFAIWIPNLYYWGLNQFIMQRTLGAQSLAQGQKGIVFAAFLKLLIPFIVIFPGIIAFNLYHDTMKDRFIVDEAKFEELTTEYREAGRLFTFNEGFVKHHPSIAAQMLEFNANQTEVNLPQDYQERLMEVHDEMKKELRKQYSFWNFGEQPAYGQTYSDYDYDSTFSLLVQRLTPPGLNGFMLAAVLGMIVATLAAMYNAASTIFTMDIYKQWLHKQASEKTLVLMGRISVVLAMLAGCWIAPILDDPRFGGVFWFIQEFQGFISPGVLAVFLFGIIVPRAPRMCGVAALLLCPVIYGSLMYCVSDWSFLNRMAITFIVIIAVLSLMTIWKPMKEPFKLEATTSLDLRQSRSAMVLGVLVVIITLALYAYFWDYNTPMFAGFVENFKW
jgi:SSS family solute:Na+ symporter